MSNRIKAQFFALYIGHPLTVINYVNQLKSFYPFDKNESGLSLTGILGTTIIVRRIAEEVRDNFNQTALKLRNIDQLTDNECLFIAKIFDLSPEQIADTDLREWIEAIFNEPAGYYIDGYTGNQLLAVIDFLRSIGVLVHYTYLNENKEPVTISPSQIENFGWAVTSLL